MQYSWEGILSKGQDSKVISTKTMVYNVRNNKIKVMTCLIYCNEVWGNASAVHLEPIIKIQKRAIRRITFSSYLSPSEPIFQSLNILNFRKLVIQRVSLLMFKISKRDVPKLLHALFRINNSYHNYQTRRSDESIHVPIGRTEAIYKTFSYFGAHI